MLPLLECDKILFAALQTVWRNPQLLEDLGRLFLDSPAKSRDLFMYLFVDTVDADHHVGFRLRNPPEPQKKPDGT